MGQTAKAPLYWKWNLSKEWQRVGEQYNATESTEIFQSVSRHGRTCQFSAFRSTKQKSRSKFQSSKDFRSIHGIHGIHGIHRFQFLPVSSGSFASFRTSASCTGVPVSSLARVSTGCRGSNGSPASKGKTNAEGSGGGKDEKMVEPNVELFWFVV